MDITKELQEVKTKQAQIISRINTLEQEKQQLVQEVLRLEGEVRLLLRMNGKKEGSTKDGES